MKNNIHKKWMDALYLNPQYYKGIKLQLIPCHPDYYGIRKAKRFVLGDSKYGQNIWIPNKFLTPSGVIIEGVDIDFVRNQRSMSSA